jgi:hypothetical protein
MARCRLVVVAAGLLGVFVPLLATAAEKAPAPSARKAERFAITGPLRELASAPAAVAERSSRPADIEIPHGDLPATVSRAPQTAGATAKQANVQALAPALPMPPPALAFR